jgi:hypothetical protein
VNIGIKLLNIETKEINNCHAGVLEHIELFFCNVTFLQVLDGACCVWLVGTVKGCRATPQLLTHSPFPI